MTSSDGCAPIFVYSLRVRFGECDPQGVVYTANYLMFLDVAITEMWRGLGMPYPTLVAQGTDMMMVQSNLSYRRPARSDDDLEIALLPPSLGTTSMTLDATIRRGDDVLLEARLAYVFVDPVRLTKRTIPQEVRELLTAEPARRT